MLTDLTISNLAIIEQLHIEFAPGMTVLSGETGAGKSILIDALGLTLGDRADADSVRDGSDRADISACYDTHDLPLAQQWLEDHDLAAEQECIIRRVIAKQGRSRCWVNGHPVPVRELKELGQLLVDIHGQHAHQSLLHKPPQRALLDSYGQHDTALQAVAKTLKALQATEQTIAKIEQRDASGDMRIDLLRYQVEELQALNLAAGEFAEIEVEHARLASAEKLIADGSQAYALLQETEHQAVVDQLGRVEHLLADLCDIDQGFEPAHQLVTEANIQAQEAADTLRQHVDSIAIDPERFNELEARIANIQDLARKHQIAPKELPELTQTLTQELADLEQAGERLEALKLQQQEQQLAYRKQAQKLSAARLKTAAKLGKEITQVLRTLGMPEAEFVIEVTHQPEAVPTAIGTDLVSFQISANAGQAARPLERVASGGELSRISLAIEVIAADSSPVLTRIFDEVDTGIGGRVAEIVGHQLYTLGQQGQTLCVTHLPQVAALADHHLWVSKQTQNQQTTTQIMPLSPQDRVNEIARMLGGINITEQTRAHAQEMINRAKAGSH